MKSATQSNTPAPGTPPVSFEAALQELEQLVQTLENGGGSLEDSLRSYERGMGLLGFCQNTLGQAEQKISLLEQGGLLQDFAPAATTKTKDAA